MDAGNDLQTTTRTQSGDVMRMEREEIASFILAMIVAFIAFGLGMGRGMAHGYLVGYERGSSDAIDLHKFVDKFRAAEPATIVDPPPAAEKS
jgi:hypothetical protein